MRCSRIPLIAIFILISTTNIFGQHTVFNPKAGISNVGYLFGTEINYVDKRENTYGIQFLDHFTGFWEIAFSEQESTHVDLLFGKIIFLKQSKLHIRSGVGVTWGTYIKSTTYDPSNGVWNEELDGFTSLAIPLQAGFRLPPALYGVGIDVYANLNPKLQAYGVMATFNLGDG